MKVLSEEEIDDVVWNEMCIKYPNSKRLSYTSGKVIDEPHIGVAIKLNEAYKHLANLEYQLEEQKNYIKELETDYDIIAGIMKRDSDR